MISSMDLSPRNIHKYPEYYVFAVLFFFVSKGSDSHDFVIDFVILEVVMTK